ncbi:MAG: recombinase family protein [Phycisphaeraceae bacterium]
MEAWWAKTRSATDSQTRLRAVAYYRHSAEIGQENSVEIQQDNVRSFAERHDIEIINEFADRGKSGLNAEGRPAFNEMMDWVRTRDDFVLILVLDVSRWGRFQDTDLSAHYESLCTQHNKQVIYTNIGFTRDEDRLINQLRKSIDRYQSAEYSRTLSKKVFEGAAKVAHQGYRWTTLRFAACAPERPSCCRVRACHTRAGAICTQQERYYHERNHNCC